MTRPTIRAKESDKSNADGEAACETLFATIAVSIPTTRLSGATTATGRIGYDRHGSEASKVCLFQVAAHNCDELSGRFALVGFRIEIGIYDVHRM